MKRWIILLHRYAGIPMSVVFVVWFVSGIVMIYTGGMPDVTSEMRSERLAPIDFSTVQLPLAEAVDRESLRDASLQMLLGRPLYRFRPEFGPAAAVFADNGERFDRASLEQARQIAADFAGRPVDEVRFVTTIQSPDQWTITESNNLPLDRFDVADGRGTRVYVSRSSGEVELMTTRGTRLLAWAGAIPHWFYFTPLRTQQPLWYWTVVWVSVAGVALALLGLVLAFTQFRRTRPFKLANAVRYRGWMRWHYYSGALFGIFAVTWAFSGLMSMEPFEWTARQGFELPRDVLAGGPLVPADYPRTGNELVAALAAAAPGGAPGPAGRPVEIEYLRIHDRPYLQLDYRPSTGIAQSLLDASSLTRRETPFDRDAIVARVEAASDGVAVVQSELMHAYDAYYYSQDDAAPLPVLRIELDDPLDTWYYVDPRTSRIVTAHHRLDRVERWLFNGLHSLDFGFWYGRRPLWDIGVIVLSLGALATSGIGLYVGWRRLLRRPVAP
ncbi:MAG: PepSY domain-containing protein [Gammaproteobacteria bacterium]|nr:PepSY domain-containing protein [Gammaproteobacteria bacterium]